MVHCQRLAIGLLQVFTEGGKIGFTLRRGSFFVIAAQHQRAGILHLHIRQKLLVDDVAQIVRVGLDLRLFILQAIEGFLRRFIHQLIRIGLVCRLGGGQRGNHQHGDHE
ncbi:hypothetical protein SB00610_02398 [Klebsiella quasipneumoniae subsp. similipneumoniae]|nr:hypothetical protein SB00610_02398 [Klebsiella quasipneumoniae subsp. similipneumoniae]